MGFNAVHGDIIFINVYLVCINTMCTIYLLAVYILLRHTFSTRAILCRARGQVQDCDLTILCTKDLTSQKKNHSR